MAIFWLIFFKIISVLLSILLGFIAGKSGKVERDSISSLLFYFIAPVVFFTAPANSNLSFSSLSISVLTFTIASLLCFFSYFLWGKIWQDERRNILALSAGTNNSGYFVLPVAIALFDDTTLSIYMLAIIGVNIYESSLGFYMGARSIASTQESIMRIIKMPSLNGFALGCLLSFSGFNLPDFLDHFVQSVRNMYSILGMMMVGLGLASLNKFEIDLKFTLAALASKFIFYPIAILGFIYLDIYLLKWYNIDVYNSLLLLSVAPIAVNTIIISSLLKFHPGRSATAVLVSSLLALIIIPLFMSIFLFTK